MRRERTLPERRGGERALGTATHSQEPVPAPEPQWQERCLGFSEHGMAATAHGDATAAAVEILEEGGNAFDAAAAAAFTLGVCEPAASGLGGQTVVLAHLAGRGGRLVLDGSSRAPHRVVPGSLTQDDVLFGHRATTVPGTPATLGYMVGRFGAKNVGLKRVLEPAVRLARHGFEVSELLNVLSRRKLFALRAGSAGRIFLDENRQPLEPGTILEQPALARTLERLGDAGVEDFYTGELADAIVRDMYRHNGLIHADDLAQIPWPIQRKPHRARFRGRRIYTVGPPGAGRALIFLLHVLDRFDPSETDPDTPRGAQLFALADRQAQRDRKDRPYDPHLYPQVTREQMLGRAYARKVAERFAEQLRDERAVDPERGRFARASGDTTHLSVMDRDGNVVGLTQSIESIFGSCEASEELGFLYNNYLSTFEYVDISHPHYLRPGASPWASVAPSIIYDENGPQMVIGSPGSERIVSAISQVLLRMEHQEPLHAVAAPRLHGALDGSVSVERERMRLEVLDHLEALELELVDRGNWSFFMGSVQLVLLDGDGFIGVADPRRDGAAEGPTS